MWAVQFLSKLLISAINNTKAQNVNKRVPIKLYKNSWWSRFDPCVLVLLTAGVDCTLLPGHHASRPSRGAITDSERGLSLAVSVARDGVRLDNVCLDSHIVLAQYTAWLRSEM